MGVDVMGLEDVVVKVKGVVVRIFFDDWFFSEIRSKVIS